MNSAATTTFEYPYKGIQINLEEMNISKSVDPLMSNTTSYLLDFYGYYCDVTRDILCLSDKVTEYAQIINIVIISGFLSLFGIVTNTIHLIVFVRLGFKETINISLFALSISDLGASIMLVWVTICFNPLLLNSKVPIDSDEIYYYTGAFPRDIFMMITAFLTTLISIERYLCIFFPLKVKNMVTTKVVTTIIIAIYVISMASLLHAYRIFRLDWWWDSYRNMSVITGIYHPNYMSVEESIRHIYTVYTFTCYFTVSTCTALFSWKLKERSEWRQTVSGQKDTTSSIRDQQIVKTVTFVAVIFIVCYFPGIVIICLMSVSPDIDIGKKYHNLYIVVDSVNLSIGAINASANIFVYYRMMSKYRAVFRSLFTTRGVKD